MIYAGQSEGGRSDCTFSCVCRHARRCHAEGQQVSKLNVLGQEFADSRRNLEIEELKLKYQILKVEIEMQTIHSRALIAEMEKLPQRVRELEESMKSIRDILG